MSDNAPVPITDLMPILKKMQNDGMLYVSFDRVSGGYVILGFERPEEYGREAVSAHEYEFIQSLDKVSRQ